MRRDLEASTGTQSMRSIDRHSMSRRRVPPAATRLGPNAEAASHLAKIESAHHFVKLIQSDAATIFCALKSAL